MARPRSHLLDVYSCWHFVVYIDRAQHDLSNRAATASFLVETCAHEAAHVAGMVLDHVEHEYRGQDEPHAYLVGWVAQWLWNATRFTKSDST